MRSPLTLTSSLPFSRDVLQSYLYLGADYTEMREAGPNLLVDFDASECRSWVRRASEQQLVEEGVRRLFQAGRDALDEAGSGPHVLQLSGGYDSRAVLGCLLKYLEPSEITTATFGTPGAPDFEIPKLLARRVGVVHEGLDATSVEFDTDNVVNYAATALESHPVALVVERYINYVLRTRFERNSVYWDGFLGGSLAGSKLPTEPSVSWDEALGHFLSYNRICRSTTLFEPDWDPRAILPEEPLVSPSRVGMDDQLNIAGRQAHLIDIPWHGFRNQRVFSQPVWKNFMLALPWNQRADGKRLFLKILARAFPKLSRYEVQGGRARPRPLEGVAWFFDRLGKRGQAYARRLFSGLFQQVPDVMRLDYADMIRGQSSHAIFVRDMTIALDRRDTVSHVDVEALWCEHASGIKDHTSALMMLAGLEVNLRAMEKSREVKYSQVRAST